MTTPTKPPAWQRALLRFNGGYATTFELSDQADRDGLLEILESEVRQDVADELGARFAALLKGGAP